METSDQHVENYLCVKFQLNRPGSIFHKDIAGSFQIAISPVLLGQKYSSRDQIQGLDASYPMDPIRHVKRRWRHLMDFIKIKLDPE